jgi:hypothetical protein
MLGFDKIFLPCCLGTENLREKILRIFLPFDSVAMSWINVKAVN